MPTDLPPDLPSDPDTTAHRRTVVAGGSDRPGVTTVLGDRGRPPIVASPPRALQDGRYVLRRVLGRGGFGITYECDDTRLRRAVAVKALAPVDRGVDLDEAKARFQREATVLARFAHPGIVRIYEVFEERGVAYLVMELLDGPTLADVVDARGAPLTEPEALDVGVRCAQALAVVHHAGVSHRDLNPSNLVLTNDGRVVLIDFGLAREFAADRTGTMTRVVTPGYAPPEQYLAAGRFGPATDVYGLAATLYRLLTGDAPTSALDRQAGVALAAPARLNAAVSRGVSDAVLDGLELHAAHRPQTMDDFMARLGCRAGIVPGRSPLLDRSVPARPPAGTAAPMSVPTQAQAPEQGATAAVLTGLIPPDPPAPAPVVEPARWKVLVPVLAAIAGLGSAAPALVVSLLALAVLPGLATAGDAAVFVRLRRRGTRLRWVHRVALPVFVPLRFVRNVAAVLQSGVPALLVAGATIALVLLLDASVAPLARELAERLGGALVALLLAVPVFADRVRFRAAVIGDLAIRRLLPEGRLSTAGIAVCVVAAMLAVAGAGFRPELWPLRR